MNLCISILYGVSAIGLMTKRISKGTLWAIFLWIVACVVFTYIKD
ncbi:MAG: hypothetical protein ACOVP2_01930 [Armatimonadaceae bacterium]